MRPKHFLIVLAMVVVPTALLAVLAARSMRHREVIVESRMRENAAATLKVVSQRASDLIRHELDAVHAEVLGLLARNAGAAEIESRARQLQSDHPLIAQSYIFMNPWGFIHPESGTVDDVLVEAVRRQVAQAPGNRYIAFRQDGRVYAFTPVVRQQGLYAGCRVDPEPLRAALARLADVFSGADLVVRIAVAGSDAGAAGSNVVVQDSLVSLPTGASDAAGPSARDVLAAESLGDPLSDVRIEVTLQNPSAVRALARGRATLSIWGVVLLALGVLAGTGLVIHDASAELRRAGERSQFMIGISHDLRTPLASMKVMAESLERGSVPDEGRRRQFLQIFVRECDRLGQLVERVLFFVRLERDQFDLQHRRVRLDELVAGCVRSFLDGYAGREGAVPRIACVCDVEGGVDVTGDETALSQLVLNVLENAAEYGRHGSEPADIRVEIRTLPGKVEMTVTDRGPGLETGMHRRIFEPFFRGGDARERKLSGVGLGLSLCRRIVKLHGGSIHAVNGEGGGLKVVVRLLREKG